MNEGCPICQRPFKTKRRCYFCTSKKRTGETRKCKTCNKPFYAEANVIADVNRNSGQYCSRACTYEAMRGRQNWRATPEKLVEHSAGYWLEWAPDHPRASRGRVLQHILVAERSLGRLIGRDEEVHHKDHNPKNNGPDNLIVLTASEHAKLHAREGHSAVIARRPTISCEECGVQFQVKPYQADTDNPHSRRKYCSLACRHKSWGRQMAKIRKRKV